MFISASDAFSAQYNTTSASGFESDMHTDTSDLEPNNINIEDILNIRKYAIGDTGPAGGIVFYVTDDGIRGLEAAPEDQTSSSGVPWGCHQTAIDGANGFAVGTGAQNTADILAGCGEAGIAARLCNEYTLNGYNDWFLPSKDELDLLYQQNDVVGGFNCCHFYFSSTEVSNDSVWCQNLNDGLQWTHTKWEAFRVRAIRVFSSSPQRLKLPITKEIPFGNIYRAEFNEEVQHMK